MMRKYNLLNQIRFDVILCGKRIMASYIYEICFELFDGY